MRDRKPTYVNVRVSYDIETSAMREEWTERKISFAYSHALCVDGVVTVVRTYEQLYVELQKLVDEHDVTEHHRLAVYVHNLGYEFGHMKGFFEWDDVFSIGDKHKVARASTVDGIEFRCSMLLANQKLEYVGKDVGVEKLVGDLDYKLVRHQETPLTDAELGYIHNDVLVMDAFLQKQLEEDTLSSIPMTKTGYVRRRVRKAVRRDKFSSAQIKKLKLTTDDYVAARACFAGGSTHGNAEYSGKVVSDVAPYDLASSYLHQITAKLFPMSSFFELPPERVRDNLGSLAMMLEVQLEDIVCRYPFAVISKSHCSYLESSAVIDNGRVHEASRLTMWITDVDLEIILRNYEIGGLTVLRAKAAQYDYLPRAIVTEVLEMYRLKTELKGVVGEEHRYKSNKEDALSVYGMSATDPVKVQWEHVGGGELEAVPVDLDEAINDHNTSRSRFLFYPWGVWVTAHARADLHTLIMDLTDAGYKVLYCDTDSTYTIWAEGLEDVIAAANKKVGELHAAAAEAMDLDPEHYAPKDPDGVPHPVGAWEHDNNGENYAQFKTLGAKRYATIDQSGKFKITVAGLNKVIGAQYVEAHGGMDFFKDGMTIPAESSGRLVHAYSDELVDVLVTDYLGNEARVQQRGFVHLEAAPYTLTVGDEYQQFLQRFNLD